MTNILVIDNYSPRHEKIQAAIESVFSGIRLQFLESIDVSTIMDMNIRILIVHKNNPEYQRVVRDASLAKYRVFFSGGYSGHFKESDFEHYVTPQELSKALIDINTHMGLQ
jgi:hypothetical protein